MATAGVVAHLTGNVGEVDLGAPVIGREGGGALKTLTSTGEKTKVEQQGADAKEGIDVVGVRFDDPLAARKRFCEAASLRVGERLL